MNPKIFVTGATGNVGSEVVLALQSAGVPCRIGVRHPEKIVDVYRDSVQVIAFDFLSPATFDGAFTGIEKLFLVRPPRLANVDRDIAPAIHHAISCGVKHIVFLSLQGVENAFVTPHYKTESLIKTLVVDYTFLRAGFFMQNLNTTHQAEIRDEHIIAVPVGNAKTSFIDVRDIGAVGAKILIEEGHRNQSYTLTGAEALTYDDVATTLSDVLGHHIRYTRPNPIRFFGRNICQGQDFGYAFVVTALYTATRWGNAEHISSDVQTILKREPIPFLQFVTDYKAYWL